MLQTLLTKIQSSPETVQFADVMDVIAELYDYTPAGFANGETFNEPGTNEGSCKLFAFAKLQGLDQQQTLACFGDYYREDVLKHPEGTDHANIRNFMQHGWEGIRFDAEPLKAKA